MRIEGKIISWNDEKGFGFVKPNSERSQIFLHISAFPNRKRKPKIGDKVNYIVSTDNLGRPCGESACLDGDRHPRKNNRRSETLSYVIAISFFCGAGLSFYWGKIPFDILAIYITVSLMTFIIYALDKSAAQNGRWRTQESTLHILSFLGGWPGAIIAQQKLRHKSKKGDFRFVFWLTAMLNIGVFIWFHTPDGAKKLQIWIMKFHHFVDAIK